jgi:hypothetical protein
MGTVERPDGDLPAPPRPGAIEAQVRADVEALVTEHAMGESLAELAFMLARRLDDRAGTKDLAVAGISKELRETLVELAGMGVDTDDDLGDALSVSTSLRDPAQP